MGLLRRCDAFGMGMDAYEHDPHDDAETREEIVAVLREEHERACEEFRHYRDEVGILDRPSERNARKPA
ncbi:MAG: hypothetical protein AVDCRST_MAG03-688 [uncultured Rubrobacteraceae bacterium]|uniref:Uncharacterized protein n=1 Tax=uncultured Rubrobacteraceae bacterium TaxID=349277 RepID=A0A6J4NMZ2_9ACTN|nr:MAG: hypothetical protein AVDCRST_MAG03-688 [uncultured Rubrobacteraceae bacterium]